eukprot:1282151-Alexandrium_andersonii.AAC.1
MFWLRDAALRRRRSLRLWAAGRVAASFGAAELNTMGAAAAGGASHPTPSREARADLRRGQSSRVAPAALRPRGSLCTSGLARSPSAPNFVTSLPGNCEEQPPALSQGPRFEKKHRGPLRDAPFARDFGAPAAPGWAFRGFLSSPGARPILTRSGDSKRGPPSAPLLGRGDLAIAGECGRGRSRLQLLGVIPECRAAFATRDLHSAFRVAVRAAFITTRAFVFPRARGHLCVGGALRARVGPPPSFLANFKLP